MQQVVLLGASNLALSLPVALNVLRAQLNQPLEIYAVRGHGRSYGRWSRFLYFRQLPGVVDCRLWQTLEQAPAGDAGPLSVVTDIGNDLFYGCSVASISTWVKTCIERLQARQGKVVLTALPMERIERLSARDYYLLRTLFFPACRISWDSMRARAITLNSELEKLAGRTGATLVTPEPQWYGLDPLHIRHRQHQRAWSKILQAAELTQLDSGTQSSTPDSGVAKVSLSARFKLLRLPPAERRLFGKLQTSSQPVASWSDGSSLLLF